jgi:hypothetical protein
MKKLFYIVLLFALASCASTSPYTLDLAYQPTAPRATIEEGTLTVVLFNDKRDVADKTLIGMKDDEEKFVSFSYGPARAVSDAVGAYLQNRGYIVHTLYEAWDGTAQSLKPEWGDMVIGGNIEDLHITVTSAFPKTKYRCSVKLRVIMADPKT